MSACKRLIIAIVGPTASGKSALAHELAKKLQTEVISADSRLIYKGMNIGTAKPSVEERNEVVYRAIDLIEPSEEYSLGKYIEDVHPAMENLLASSKIPVVVGGTGFYLRGLLEGLPLTEVPPNQRLREELKNLETNILFAKLKEKDFNNKWKMHFNDRARIIRALEIEDAQVSGQVIIEKPHQIDAKVLWIGLNYSSRDKLRQKIKLRAELMMQAGLLNEVENLLKKYGELEIFKKTIGYKESLDFMSGQLASLDELVEKITIASSQYAKRQMTWFKRNQLINWLDSEMPLCEMLNEAKRLVARS